MGSTLLFYPVLWRPEPTRFLEMKVSSNEVHQQEAYSAPVAEIVIIQHEHSLLTGSNGDDDDTGGTGHNMPWDD